MAAESKKTRGRQKVELKKIENEEDLYATFSKRREGIYKKTSELCTLCDIDIGIIIFSPTGKPFSFGHPSVDSIIQRFKRREPAAVHDSASLVEAHCRSRIDELNRQVEGLGSRSEGVKECGKTLEERETAREEIKGWWESAVTEMPDDEASKTESLFQEVERRLNHWINMLLASSSSSSLPFYPATDLGLPPPPPPPPASSHQGAGPSTSFARDPYNPGNMDF